jgi:hypothetical protein
MGFISDLIFGPSPKPRVTKDEWQRVRSALSARRGFNKRELDEIEEIFRADLYENKKIDNGITTDELVRGIQWMRSNMSKHKISENKINAVEEEMMKKIANI